MPDLKNIYNELFEMDEGALKRVRATNAQLGLPAYCQFCGASATTFSANQNRTVDFRCHTRARFDRDVPRYNQSDLCRRLAELANMTIQEAATPRET